MKSMLEYLCSYAGYHRDRRNIATHFIGIPTIVFAVLVLLWRPTWGTLGPFVLNPSLMAVLVTTLFYLRLDTVVGVAMGTFFFSNYALVAMLFGQLDPARHYLWGLGLFVGGWLLQAIGHVWEGRKPAFVDDLIGLLIGPLFILMEVAFFFGWRKPLAAAIVHRVGPTRVGKSLSQDG